MSDDWEKLAGEEGEAVISGRLGRMVRLGKMGARVAASTMAGKLGSLLPGDRDRREERLRAVLADNADHVAEVLGQLKGASMKVGQMLSADPELVPPEFSRGLARLQRDAPPMTYNTVRQQIEDALDRPIETVFSYFDPAPLGSASIGQVHRARLDTGEEVAVKVQYPGVVESLDSDLKSLSQMAGLYGRAFIDKARLDEYLGEIRQVLLEEADYVAEAQNLADFHGILAARDGIISPRPYPEHTRKSVLVMEYIEGVKFDAALEQMGPSQRRTDLLMRWMCLYSWLFHEVHALHADPHPGNFLLDADDNLVVLDFGCVKRFDPAFTDAFLDVLDACWQRDHERALRHYADIGFGTKQGHIDRVDPELMWQYNQIVVAPFMADQPFDFGDWRPAFDGKMFMLKHPSFLRLVPPKDALLYFRALSGIKGLLATFDARLNVFEMAVETARRRGRLTGEPRRTLDESAT